VPSWEGTLAPPGEYDWTCASFIPPKIHNPNGKLTGSAVFAQLTAESLYTVQWAHFPKIASFHGGSGPHLIHDSFGPSKPTIQVACWSVQPFCTYDCSVPILYNGTHLTKTAPSHGGRWLPSNTWFLWPTWVLNPNGISICSAIFAGLTTMTDRPKGQVTRSVTIGHMYLHSTAMWPKKWRKQGLETVSIAEPLQNWQHV